MIAEIEKKVQEPYITKDAHRDRRLIHSQTRACLLFIATLQLRYIQRDGMAYCIPVGLDMRSLRMILASCFPVAG